MMNNIFNTASNLLETDHRIRKAIEASCLVCNISEKAFKTRSRERHIIDCRRMVYSFCREILKLSWKSIGKFFNINHATAIHHHKAHKQLLEFDKFYKNKYDSFCELVKADIGFVDVQNIINQVREIKKQSILKQRIIKDNLDKTSSR